MGVHTAAHDFQLSQWRSTLFEPCETELLRACLLDEPAATAAWRRFIQLVGDPRSYFESNYRGIKGLLPFVATQIPKIEPLVSNDFKTYARVAHLREELRAKIYFDVMETLEAQFRAAGVAAVWLKGAALSRLLYEADGIRHNHALEVMISAAALEPVSARLQHAGMKPVQHAGAPGERILAAFEHESGLPIVVHSGQAFAPFCAGPPESDGVAPLSGAALLWNALRTGLFSEDAGNLRWVVDTAKLILQERVDWGEFEQLLRPLPYAHQIVEALHEICSVLELPTPSLSFPKPNRRLAADVFFSSFLTRRHTHGELIARCAPEPYLLFRYIQFAIWPPTGYVSWRYRHTTATLRLKWRIARVWRALLGLSGRRTVVPSV